MDAVIIHKDSRGDLLRLCQRCLQYVDAAGVPDPKRYSLNQLIKFSEIPVEDRCKHKREYLSEFERGRLFGIRTIQAELNLFRGVVKDISELAGKYI